jgi:uncharacterized protein (DUF58 family)
MRAEAERLSHALPALLLQARRVAAIVASGAHGRRASGSGDEFWQYRAFAPGDAMNRIDWRQSGKSNRVYVRETEWEIAHSVFLWCDGSASMDFASASDSKHHRGQLILLAQAALLLRGGERVRLLHQPQRRFGGRQALEELAACVATPQVDWPATDIPTHAHVVLFSDFLQPVAEIEAHLNRLSLVQADATLLQILDPAECDLPYHGPTRFQGPEGEADLLIGDPDSVRARYRHALDAHLGAVGDLCAKRRFNRIVHRTDHPPETALLALYQHFENRA